MNNLPNQDRRANRATNAERPGLSPNLRPRTKHSAALCTLLLGLSSLAMPAHAVDGCLVLLCFAAPSWRAIPQCVPPIRQVLFDLARGRAFPTCGMSGPGNSADHTWSSAPDKCPPQYTREFDGPNGPLYSCDYSGAITVSIKGALFSRTWWSMAGDAVTEFSPSAKVQLGTWDSRFDDDYAAWLATQPPPADPNP